MTSYTKQVGGSGEFVIIHELLDMQFDVFRDVTDSCSADIIAVKDGRCTRIQVKTITSIQGSIGIKLWKPSGKSWCRYDGNEFDVLAVYVTDYKVTLFFTLQELLATKNKSAFSVRMTPSVHSRHNRLYTDYLSFERCITLIHDHVANRNSSEI